MQVAQGDWQGEQLLELKYYPLEHCWVEIPLQEPFTGVWPVGHVFVHEASVLKVPTGQVLQQRLSAK